MNEDKVIKNEELEFSWQDKNFSGKEKDVHVPKGMKVPVLLEAESLQKLEKLLGSWVWEEGRAGSQWVCETPAMRRIQGRK